MVKLVFFDMEGTLFRKAVKMPSGNVSPSAWALLAEHLGEEALAEEKKTQVKWNSGEYAGYVEWMEDTLRVYQKYDLEKDFFETVMNSIEYHPGVHEVFDYLRNNGIRTGLISGGFKAQANRAQRDLKIDHAFAACELFWGEQGKLEHWNLLPCDYLGKKDFMQLIIQEHGLTPEECAFVGDGRNDVHLANTVGLSISFNGAHELEEACTHAIRQDEGKEDFKAVLEYL